MHDGSATAHQQSDKFLGPACRRHCDGESCQWFTCGRFQSISPIPFPTRTLSTISERDWSSRRPSRTEKTCLSSGAATVGSPWRWSMLACDITDRPNATMMLGGPVPGHAATTAAPAHGRAAAWRPHVRAATSPAGMPLSRRGRRCPRRGAAQRARSSAAPAAGANRACGIGLAIKANLCVGSPIGGMPGITGIFTGRLHRTPQVWSVGSQALTSDTSRASVSPRGRAQPSTRACGCGPAAAARRAPT